MNLPCRNDFGTGPEETHRKMYTWAKELKADDKLIEILDLSTQTPPKDYIENQDWVLLSFHNALWHLLNTRDPAERQPRSLSAQTRSLLAS